MSREPEQPATPGRGPNRRLIFLLSLANRRVQQRSSEQEHGTTAAQAGVLFLLGAKNGALIGEVARALRVGPSGLSGLVDRMEAAGLVRRAPDGKDGRAVRLALTDQGWAAREVAKKRAATANALLAEGFSEDELDIVARWLSTVADHFKKGTEE